MDTLESPEVGPRHLIADGFDVRGQAADRRAAAQSGSAADVAVGFCTGTPLRMAIEARGDLMASAAVVSDEMTRHLGGGPVAAKMTANIFEARGPRPEARGAGDRSAL